MFHSSYAVLWCEGEGPIRVGKLVLGPNGLLLETGAGRARASSKMLRYADLTSVGIVAPSDRIRTRPTAAVGRSERDPVKIAAVDDLGSLREIIDRIAAHLSPVAGA